MEPPTVFNYNLSILRLRKGCNSLKICFYNFMFHILGKRHIYSFYYFWGSSSLNYLKYFLVVKNYIVETNDSWNTVFLIRALLILNDTNTAQAWLSKGKCIINQFGYLMEPRGRNIPRLEGKNLMRISDNVWMLSVTHFHFSLALCSSLKMMETWAMKSFECYLLSLS